MITKTELEKVIEQINSILSGLDKRIKEVEKATAELKAKPKGRPRKLDSEVTTN